jgi:hypothetical protein
MDNWIVQLLGWIGAFILGVFVNLATPVIRSMFQRSTLSLRNRRIKVLTSRYEAVKAYNENPSKLTVFSSQLMAEGLRRLTLLIILCTAAVITGIRNGFNDATFNFVIYTIGITGGYVSSKFDDIERAAKDTTNFEPYRVKTVNQLKRWGGNPEILDKIDREIEAEKQGE